MLPCVSGCSRAINESSVDLPALLRADECGDAAGGNVQTDIVQMVCLPMWWLTFSI